MIIPSCYYSQRKPTKQFPRRAAHPVPKRPSRVRSFFFQGTWRWLISFQCSGSFWLWLMYYQKEKKLFFLVCWLLKWSVYTFAYWQFGKCHRDSNRLQQTTTVCCLWSVGSICPRQWLVEKTIGPKLDSMPDVLHLPNWSAAKSDIEYLFMLDCTRLPGLLGHLPRARFPHVISSRPWIDKLYEMKRKENTQLGRL